MFVTEEDFDDLLLRFNGPAYFRFELKNAGARVPDWVDEAKLIPNNNEPNNKQLKGTLSSQQDKLRVTYFGVGVFELRDREIICYPEIDSDPILIKNLFLSSVISFWMEWKGYITFHASSVLINEQVVAFLAHHGQGKSSIAVSLLQKGYSLITDDILPIKKERNNLLAFPGFPVIRLWRNEAERYCRTTDQLHKVHPATDKFWVPVDALQNASFRDLPAPVGCFYLLERRNYPEAEQMVEIVPVPPRDAVIELTRYSFTPRFASRVKNEKERFAVLSSIALEIPVRRIIYPSGYQHIPLVIEQIMSDLNKIL